MGWTSYIATNYKNGKVDRKTEMDMIYTWKGDLYEHTVLKSRMVGSTYYAAVNVHDIKENKNQVIAVVALTSTAWKDGMNFGYKSMDETMGPVQCNCPKSILDLLTPIESEYANNWRKKCYKNLTTTKLSDLPIGSVIKFIGHDGTEIKLIKHQPAYQFKRPFWMYTDRNNYYIQKHIPSNWELVQQKGE